MSNKKALQKEANKEFLRRRVKRLQENTAAISLLTSLGINEKILKQFYLGLSESYTGTNKLLHENALVSPVINSLGKPLSRSIYFNLPEITVNPLAETFWSKGDPQTYYSSIHKSQKSLIICSNLLELWLLHSIVNCANQKSKIVTIVSSHQEEYPAEWYESNFWSGFENIYIAYPNDVDGDKNALHIAKIAGNRVKRTIIPLRFGTNWHDFCRTSGNPVEDFTNILTDAKPFNVKLGGKSGELAEGRFAYQPVDVAGAYHNGHLYYPVKTLNKLPEKYSDENGSLVSQIAERVETVLVRSDREIQHVIEVPAPRGTPLNERVLKLTDGTLIESRPKSSAYSTWSWESIEKFRDEKSKTRTLDKILADIKDFLKESVWLPFSHDYDLLTLVVPVTFAQAIFKSVPLILVTGIHGSGKSALGKAMIKICANASMVGQTSAAAIARLIDETKGFVVFDDLESIGKRKGRETPQFSELIQALKLSYNKETSWKMWTDVSRGMSVKKLNFYGVKMINNTTGTDAILGSRALKIYTRRAPDQLQREWGAFDSWDIIKLNKLRDELHTWTFENVGLIDQTYQRLFPASTDRSAEIFAPLRVFAELSGDEDIQDGLGKALEFQNTDLTDNFDPVKTLSSIVKQLVIAGETTISPTQILLDVEKVALNKPTLDFNGNIKWQSPAWVGRQLRTFGVIDINSDPVRQLFDGKYIRIYPIKRSYIKSIQTASKTKKK